MKPPLPKEHGSWAMFIVPLVLGLAVAPTWEGPVIWLLLAALAFFLLRYPLAMLVKTRRSQRVNRGYWLKWAAVYGLVSGGVGLWLVFGYGLWLLLWVGVIGAGLLALHLWLVARRQEMSVVGELAGIFGLALGAPMAYYTASGQLDRVAAVLWLINALYFGGTVFYIKLKVRQQPRLPAPARVAERLVKARACLTYHTAALTIAAGLVAFRMAPLLTPLAFVPVTIKAVRGALHWQDKKSLSLVRLGVAEIFHALAFTILIILAFRGNGVL